MIDWNPRSLADEYGTPLMVFSLPRLRQQLMALRAAWAQWPAVPPQFYFPLKTNDFGPFVRFAAGHGLGFDVTEGHEIDLAVNQLHVAPAKIVVSGPAKVHHVLQRAVRSNVRVHVDSLAELQAIREIAKRLNACANVGIRLRLGELSKFGFCPTDAELARAMDLLAQSPELSLVAIHQHDAQSLRSIEELERTLLALSRFCKRQKKLIHDGRLEINLGGGLNLTADDSQFGDYRDFVAAFATATRRTGTGHWRFGFEWGRALVGPCGSIVASVVCKKESEGRAWLYLDAGQNVIGGGHAAVKHRTIRVLQRTPSEDAGTCAITVAGPLCFRSDVIADAVSLPRCKPGDIVVIGDAGAYTFNTRWHGPGKDPVVLLETESGIRPVGRLSSALPERSEAPRVLDDLFRLFFRDEFDLIVTHSSPAVTYGVSAGTNNLDPPESLKTLLENEIAAGDAVKAYTGPYGSDEIAVAALAFEEALAANGVFDRDRCVVTLGAAQGCARALTFLHDVGHDHCVIAGPQYPLVHDILRRLRFEITEVLGSFDAGHLPSEDYVVDALRSTARSVLFLTVPNNPTGTCPTESWLRTVFNTVAETRGHVLIDRSSEDLPVQAWVRFSPTTFVASRVLPNTAYTIVNSCSKSRSVPGIRVGYLLGSAPMARSVADFNYSEYLALPRTGTRFVAADLVLRSLWWRQTQAGETPRQAADNVRRTVCRTDGPALTADDFAAFSDLLPQYISECGSRLATIKTAQEQFAAGLGEMWLGCTPHHNGFNVIGQIAVGKSGTAFAQELFRSTGIRLLPSECFTVDGLPLPTSHVGLAFRLSSADRPERLRGAATLLASHIRRIAR